MPKPKLEQLAKLALKIRSIDSHWALINDIIGDIEEAKERIEKDLNRAVKEHRKIVSVYTELEEQVNQLTIRSWQVSRDLRTLYEEYYPENTKDLDGTDEEVEDIYKKIDNNRSKFKTKN